MEKPFLETPKTGPENTEPGKKALEQQELKKILAPLIEDAKNELEKLKEEISNIGAESRSDQSEAVNGEGAEVALQTLEDEIAYYLKFPLERKAKDLSIDMMGDHNLAKDLVERDNQELDTLKKLKDFGWSKPPATGEGLRLSSPNQSIDESINAMNDAIQRGLRDVRAISKARSRLSN